MKDFPLWRVEWIDSTNRGGWQEAGKDLDLSKCITVGFLVKDNDERVVIASSIDDNDEIANLTAIPRQVVTKMERIDG